MISVLKYLRGITLLVFLTVAVLFANLCQLMSVILIPFSKTSFMKFNMFVKASYCGMVARCCFICGNRLAVSGDVTKAENAIVMANHQSYMDIPIIWMWALPLGTIGWMKWFVKDEFKYVPGLGWGLKFAHALFVKRDWSKDANSIKATFLSLLEANLPFWVTIFPEGTRMKPVKYQASRAYSARKGTHVFERVLFPRPKGVWSTLLGLRSKLDAIYDVHIGFTERPPSVVRFFCEGGFTVKMHVTRFGVGSLPSTERDFHHWMQERFIEKDRWMAEHSGWSPAA